MIVKLKEFDIKKWTEFNFYSKIFFIFFNTATIFIERFY